MKWSPLPVAACGLVAGIILSAVLEPTTGISAGLFGASIMAVLAIEFLGRVSFRAAAVLAVFMALGALLFSMTPGPSRRQQSETHQSAGYKAIAAQARQALVRDESAVLLAIVFGDQSGVAPAIKDDFRRAGLLHLFAASGFNVTLAAGFIMLLARLAKLPKLLAAAMALASIAFYFTLVGPTPSVMRATVMSATLYLALFYGRPVDAFASTATAAIVLLAIDPAGLFDIGWQLSFAGLIGILFLAPKINEYIKPQVPLAAPLAITVGAQTAVAPFLLYHFGQISTIAILANPVVTLAVAYVTGVGFAGGLLALVWPAAGRFLMSSLAWPISFILVASRTFASLPAATVQLEPSAKNALVFLALLGVAVALIANRRHRLGLPAIIIIILSLQAAGTWVDLAAGIQRPALTANFLDVGQGDATLVKSKRGAVILVDGGRDFERLDRELRRRGVKRIDMLILSHAHTDHVGSLDELLAKYPVASVVEPGFAHDTLSYKDFKAAVAKYRVPLSLARAGSRFRVADVRIDILWPRQPLMAGTESDINNNSVVAKLRYGRFNLLLPGDIQKEAIAELLRRQVKLKAQVVKVSHQGSANGTTAALLARIKPEYAVIFVGQGNPYGHPHRPTLGRLRRFVRGIARTDQDGNITVCTDGVGLSLVTAR